MGFASLYSRIDVLSRKFVSESFDDGLETRFRTSGSEVVVGWKIFERVIILLPPSPYPHSFFFFVISLADLPSHLASSPHKSSHNHKPPYLLPIPPISHRSIPRPCLLPIDDRASYTGSLILYHEKEVKLVIKDLARA